MLAILPSAHHEAPAPRGPRRRVRPGDWLRRPSAHHVRHVARMSQEPAERSGTGRDETGCGGIPTPKHSERLRGKGVILLGVSHRSARVRFPPPPLKPAAFLHTSRRRTRPARGHPARPPPAAPGHRRPGGVDGGRRRGEGGGPVGASPSGADTEARADFPRRLFIYPRRPAGP